MSPGLEKGLDADLLRDLLQDPETQHELWVAGMKSLLGS